jgi:hypothetical protein
MAGDWIKMRSALPTCPKTAAVARAIGTAPEFSGLSRQSMRLLVVGGLHAVWAAVNEHTADGVMENAYLEDVDDIAGIDGFGQAMREAGWLEVDEAARTLTFPNFGQWNTPAKDTTAAERMRKHREKQRVTPDTVTVTDPLRVTVTPLRATVTLDKTRQDKNTYIPAAPVPQTKPATPSRSVANAAISWSADAGFTGITDADRQAWATAYPGAVLDQELAKATEWLKANPKRCGKRNWRKFLVGWLGRCQERGGSIREAGRRPDEAPKPRAWKDDYVPAPYRRPKEVVALANGLKLKEEDL